MSSPGEEPDDSILDELSDFMDDLDEFVEGFSPDSQEANAPLEPASEGPSTAPPPSQQKKPKKKRVKM